MAFSKVIFNGDTLMDVTQDTVAANNLLSGYQATGANGQKVAGATTVPTNTSDLTNDGDDGTHPFLSTADLLNSGTQTTAGVYALDAAYGKTLADAIGSFIDWFGLGVQLSDCDMDDILTPDKYYILPRNSASITNMPITTFSGTIYVFPTYNVARVIQLAIGTGGDLVALRAYTGSWGSWRSFDLTVIT